MKKTKFMAMAAALVALASCTSSDETFEGLSQEQLAQENAIQFSTFVGSGAETRTIASGSNGSIGTEEMAAKGFGVFAYYTGTDDWATFRAGTTADYKPNFMYNQQVTSSSAPYTTWTYAPVKYWPNEVRNDSGVNDSDNQGAQTSYANGGNVSFFAYAPYVESGADGTVAGVDEGIVAFTANTGYGDPIVTYQIPAAVGDFVDLLWGTYSGTGNNVFGAGTNVGVSHNDAGNAYQQAILSDGSAGYTLNADLTKQKTDGTIGFAFKHALAKLGGGAGAGFKIIADVDKAESPYVSGGTLDGQTKVTVESVNIAVKAKNDAGKYVNSNRATFNLATGQWTPTVQDAEVTMYTYQISTADLNTGIANVNANTGSWVDQPTGVPSDNAVTVYKEADAGPLLLFPGTKPVLDVEITYYVRTKDTNLASGYSQVKQVIHKEIAFTENVKLNNFYKMTIHLGLTSVKFTASVTGWDSATGTDATAVEEVDLPINVH